MNPIELDRFRWWILALLFLATTINYLDRIVFAVLVADMRRELRLSDQQYGFVTAAFQGAYTAGFLIMGRVIDRYGARIGYAVSIAWWSLAAALHAISRTAVDLGFWRAMLGVGEAGNFPSAIRTVAEWFPERERALATGIFNGGTNIASVIGPPVFVWLSAAYGWRSAFLGTAGAGFFWLVLWWSTYTRTRVPAGRPEGDRAAAASWTDAVRNRSTWGFALGKFFSDPVWWFYLYWLPLYLHDVRKLDMKAVGWILPVIYLMADAGSIAGGWFSGVLIRRGWQPFRARKFTMLLCALAMPVAGLGVLAPDPLVTVALFSLATAAHQGWSANLYTTVSDVFPAQATGTVTGLGGFTGGIGGIFFSALIPGYVVTAFGYTPVFLSMGFFYLAGLFALHALMRPAAPPRTAASS